MDKKQYGAGEFERDACETWDHNHKILKTDRPPAEYCEKACQPVRLALTCDITGEKQNIRNNADHLIEKNAFSDRSLPAYAANDAKRNVYKVEYKAERKRKRRNNTVFNVSFRKTEYENSEHVHDYYQRGKQNTFNIRVQSGKQFIHKINPADPWNNNAAFLYGPAANKVYHNIKTICKSHAEGI